MEDQDDKVTEKPLTLRQVMPMRKVRQIEPTDQDSTRTNPAMVALLGVALIVIFTSLLFALTQ